LRAGILFDLRSASTRLAGRAQRPAKRASASVHVIGGGAERRRQAHALEEGAHDQAPLEGLVGDPVRVGQVREGLPGLPIAHHLHGGEHPEAADLAGDGGPAEGLAEPLEQVGAHTPGVLHQTLPLDDVEIRHRRGAAGGVVVVGEPEHQGQPRGHAVAKRLVDGVGDHGGRERQVAGGDPLGQGQQVRAQVPVLHPEPAPGASERGDHLVEDQQHVVSATDLLDLREVVGRRRDDSAGSHHGLHHEGGDRLGSLTPERLLQVGGAGQAAARVGAAELAAVAIGRGHVEVARVRLRQGVVGGDAGGADGGPGRPVVGPAARHDSRLAGVAAHRVVEPRQPEGGLVGLAPAGAEEDVAQPPVGGQQPRQAPGQPGRRLAAEVPERGVVGQLAHLGGHRLGDLGAPVPHVDVEEAREAVHHGAAVGQLELDAAATPEDPGALALVLRELVDRVDQVRPVELPDLVQLRRARVHGPAPTCSI
jgi:hypothetical protein